MNLLSDQELNHLIAELELPSNAKRYCDMTKIGPWRARVILLAAMLQENRDISKPELIYSAFSNDDTSISERFGLRKNPIKANLKIPKDKMPIISDRRQANHHSARNVVDQLVKEGFLSRTGRNNRLFVTSEIGMQIALVIYAHVLKANNVEMTDVLEFLNKKKVPKHRFDNFSMLMLVEAETKKPTAFAESLGKILQRSRILQGKKIEENSDFHVVSRIRTSLLQRVTNSESPMLLIETSSNIDIIPSDWFYRLDTYAAHDREFDFIEWYNRLNEEDFEFDDIRKLGISLIANPGHGKTKWIEQAAIEIWNNQWEESRVDTPSQMMRNVSILPVVVDLRRISTFPDLDNRSKVFYDKKNQILWPMTNLKMDPPFHKVMAHLLKAVFALPEKIQDIEQVVNDFKFGKRIILFLDGWDELSVDARKHVSQYIQYYLENQVPVVISSRMRDSYLDEITSESLTLGTLKNEDILKYASANDMDLDIGRLKNIRKWIGNITPLDLRVLSVFPELDNLPQKRVALYRNWIVFQTIREGCIDRLTKRFETVEDVKNFLVSETISINSETHTLFDLLHGFRKSVEEQLGEDFSIMHYVSKVAYFEMMDNNERLDYGAAVKQNSLLKGFIDEKLTHDLRSYPQIRQKHLIPYLAAEFILREYLSFRYWSVNGNPFTLSFLEEVLDYDKRQIPGHEKMDANQLKYVIFLEAESNDNNPQPISNIYHRNQPDYYSSMYYSLVGYWTLAVRTENIRAQNLITQCIDYLVRINCYSPTEITQVPHEFVSDIYLIERELGDIDPIPSLHGIKSPEYEIAIKDRAGWSAGFVSNREMDVFYSEQLILRPQLIPWIIKVASSDIGEKTIDLIESIPDEEFQYLILKHQLIENPSERIDAWLEVLSRIVRRSTSIDFILLLAELLTKQRDISDEILDTVLTIISSSNNPDELKYNIITSIETCSMTRIQKERIRQALHDAPKLNKKYYLSLAALHDIPNIELESFFFELEQSSEYRWMALIVKRILYDERHDLVNERFLMLPIVTINILERNLLKPQIYHQFAPGKPDSYEVQYLKDDEINKLSKICEDWWKHYLTSTKDAIDILDEILVELDDFFDEPDRKQVRYDYHSVLERLAKWVGSNNKKDQQEFILACLEMKFDITIMTERNILKPLLDNLKDNDAVNHKLLELYKETPFFLLDIWGKDTWVKYVNLFPRDILVSDERFFSYFVEAGCLSSIDDAVEAVEINPDIMRYRDTTDILIDWLSSKSIEENVSFVERVLEFDISLTYLSKILHELVPIQKYEKIYSRLIGIASSGEIMPLPRNMRENPEGFRCPKHEIAYTFLSSVEKKKIIGPMFDRLQCSENLEDEHVNNIIAEYLHIAEPEDIKKLAKFLNEFPLYSDAVCFEEGKNLQTLKEFLVNPIAKTLIEILTLGYDEFLEGADVETAKASLDILITGDSDVHFWARNYSYHMFRQRQDLQDFVIEKLESESIGWDNIFGITDWIQIILSKGQAHHTEFVASLMEKMEMNTLIELYRTLIFQKDNEYYNKLCSVLAHLSKDRPITVTISAIAHLGKQLVSDINSLWDTKQYKDLSSKDRNDLKSGRWFDKHLDNSLKGEWRLVTW